MKNRTLLLAAALLLAFTPMMAGVNSAKPENTKTEQKAPVYCGVTEQQIIDYMGKFGIRIVCTGPVDGSCNAYAKADTGVVYIVYIDNSTITGFDESGF